MLFEPFGLETLALYRDGESVPYNQPLQMDFDGGMAVQAYMRTIQSLEQFNSDASHGITLEEFCTKGRALFAFNLTPDLNVSGACGQPYRTGNLRVEMKFAKGLAATINVCPLGPA
jgi:hypothetical protein